MSSSSPLKEREISTLKVSCWGIAVYERTAHEAVNSSSQWLNAEAELMYPINADVIYGLTYFSIVNTLLIVQVQRWQDKINCDKCVSDTNKEVGAYANMNYNFIVFIWIYHSVPKWWLFFSCKLQ